MHAANASTTLAVGRGVSVRFLLGLAAVAAAVLALVWSPTANAQQQTGVSIDLSEWSNTSLADAELSPLLVDIAADATLAGTVDLSNQDIASWFGADAITVTGPNGSNTSFLRQDMEPAADGGQVWSGIGTDGSALVMSQFNDLVSMVVQLDDRVLTLAPAGDDLHLLYEDGRDLVLELGQPLTAADADFLPALAGALNLDDAIVEAAVGGVDVIDVMIVYESSSTSQFGSDTAAEANFVATVDYANTVFANTNLDIRLFLVNMTKINHTGSGSETVELPRFANPSDGYMDSIHQIRDSVRADLVTLVTPIQGCGLAYVLTQGNGPLASLGFNVIDPSCMTPSSPAYPHEVGHNLGGAHDEANAPNGSHWPNGYGYVDSANQFVTIMSYAPFNYSYLPIFSNTTEFVGANNDIATGDAQHNNAAVFSQHAAAVSRYRLGTPSVPLNVTATGTAAGSIAVSWSAPESDGGGGIVGYSAVAEPGFRACSSVPPATTCTIIGLTPGTTYTVVVRASNSAGQSLPATATATTLQSTGEVQFVTTPGQTFGWVIQNGAKQWITAGCRAQLETAGAVFTEVNYSTFGGVPNVTAGRSCLQLVELISDDDTGGDGDVSFVTQNGNPAGWVIYQGEKQWISASCRAQLEAAGAVFAIQLWGEFGSIANVGTFRSCDALEALIDDDGSTGSGLTFISTRSTGAGWVVQNGVKTWISETCRNQLATAGAVFTVSPWSEISTIPNPTTYPYTTCAEFLTLLGSGNGGGGNSLGYLTTSGNAAGWVVQDDVKQWISASCRGQLEAEGASFVVTPWVDISAITNTSNYQDCSVFVALVNQDT